MSEQIQVSRQCGRCPKEERQTITLEEALELAKRSPEARVKALEVVVDGKTVASFDHLCAACRSTVAAYLDGAARQNTKATAKRKAKEKETASNTASRSTPPPVAAKR
jgi:bacterioferritin-associated ferredoxin